MLNEGSLYEGLEPWDREQRIQHFQKQLKRGTVRSSTDRGVRIGMTESQVRRILGTPTRTLWSKRFDAREFIYRREEVWSKKKQEERYAKGMSWTNYYLFRKGRLFYIELAQDLEGGA